MLLLAAARVLLLLIRRRLLFLRLVTFGDGMIILELATTNCCIYLLSVQSPAPAISLAEPPPAASPQLGRWVCQQGLRSARIRGLLLLLLAAASACCCQCCCCCFFDDDCPSLPFYVWSHFVLV